jgi:sulfur carrier protein
MSIVVNGQTQEDATNLSELLHRMGLNGAVVATAVNGQFVSVSNRPDTPLRAGDQVEILAPMQGG